LDASVGGGAVLKEIRDTYQLITVVDNDFVGGDIFAIFKSAIATIAPVGGLIGI
jgi:hypothetical protein